MLTVLNKTGIDIELTLLDAEGSYQKTLGPNKYVEVQPDDSATHIDVRAKNVSGTPFLARGDFNAKYYGNTLYVLTVSRNGGDYVSPLENNRSDNGLFANCSGGQLEFDRRIDQQTMDMIDNYDYAYALVCDTKGLTEANVTGIRPISCNFDITNLASSIMYVVITILILLFILLLIIAAIVWLYRMNK